MLVKQLALISESANVPFKEITLISAALQKQISRDFSPIWQIGASIDAFESANDVPLGYWKIIIKDDIEHPGQSGFHLDDNDQPYAWVKASNNNSLFCSHEAMEMLTDPYGNRLIVSDSLKDEQGRVSYIVEACDPCQDIAFAYTINDLPVSDFYTPNYFDPVTAAGVRYSYTSFVKAPKQILKGGYLSWVTPDENELWQANYFGSNISYKLLGTYKQKDKSWRELVDGITSSSIERKKARKKKKR